MKYLPAFALCLGLLAAVPAPASPRQATPAEQRADRLSQEARQQLGLDAATTARLRAAALTRFQKIDAAYRSAAGPAERNQALDASSREYQAALKTILTPAQLAQLGHPGSQPAGPAKKPAPARPKAQRID